MKDVQDMTVKEYAEHMGVSERTVYRRQRTWLLENLLKQDGADAEETAHTWDQEKLIRDICQARANIRRAVRRRDLWCPEITMVVADIMNIMGDLALEAVEGLEDD